MATKTKGDTFFIIRNMFAAFFVFFHNGPSYYWGNLSIYVISYYVHKNNSLDTSLILPALTLTLYAVGWYIAMLASGPLTNLINVRLMVAIAILLQNSAFFVTYFNMGGSLLTFLITFGLLVGLGTGLYEGPVLQYYVVNLSPQHSGLLTGIALAGGPTGGVVINQLVTWFTNSNNLSPDSRAREMQIFTQVEVLDRVPTVLLVLGVSITIFQLIGIFLLQEVTNPVVANNIEPTSSRTINYNSTDSRASESCLSNCSENGAEVEETPNSCLLERRDYTPRELLRCRHFYKLFVVYTLGLSAPMVISTYYKLYGQDWISDDHFLTYLGTAQTFCSIPSSIMWGSVIDNIGVKLSMMTMYSGMALLSMLMYFTAQWNQWAYFIITTLAASVSNLYTCFNIATLKWYGSKYLATNVAIVESAASLGFVVPTVGLDTLIAVYGHFTEFAWSATSSVLGFLVIVLFFPLKRKEM